MSSFLRSSLIVGCVSAAALLGTSLLTSTTPVCAETPPAAGVSSEVNPIKPLLGAWELVQKVENGGPQQPVSPDASTLMEFAQGGVVMVTKTHKENPAKPDTRPGKFSVEGSTMLITDDQGNTARCEYRIDGETLRLVIPDIHKEFYWRRVK
jgi:hypothetical protein